MLRKFTLSLLAMTVLVPPVAADEFVFLNEITIHAHELRSDELQVARDFASCMSTPRFPTEGEFEGVEWKCSYELPDEISEQLESKLKQIRGIVSEHSGSEATLEIAAASDD